VLSTEYALNLFNLFNNDVIITSKCKKTKKSRNKGCFSGREAMMVRGLFTSNSKWQDIREPETGIVFAVFHFLIPFTFAAENKIIAKSTVPARAAGAAVKSNRSYSDLEAFFTGRSA
jgi:hypothetical protein